MKAYHGGAVAGDGAQEGSGALAGGEVELAVLLCYGAEDVEEFAADVCGVCGDAAGEFGDDADDAGADGICTEGWWQVCAVLGEELADAVAVADEVCGVVHGQVRERVMMAADVLRSMAAVNQRWPVV